MQAAFKGEKLDRHPVMLLLGGHFAERVGFTLEQFLTRPDAALEAVKITCEELDSDALFVPLNPLMRVTTVHLKHSGHPYITPRAHP